MTTISQLNQQFVQHAKNNNLEGVKTLLAQGANIDCLPTLLEELLNNQETLELFHYLVEKGAFIHANNDRLLVYCARAQYFDLFNLLLKKGANLRAQNDSCFTIFCEQGNLDMVKYYHETTSFSLINQGFKIACLQGHLELFKYFLSTGITIGDQDNNINIKDSQVLEHLVSGKKLHLIKWITEHYIFNDEAIQHLLNLSLKGHFVEVFELYPDYDLSFITHDNLTKYLNNGDQKYTAVLKHIFIKKTYSKHHLFNFIVHCFLYKFKPSEDYNNPDFFQFAYTEGGLKEGLKGILNQYFNVDIFSFLFNLKPEYKNDFFHAFHALRYCLKDYPASSFKPLVSALVQCGFDPHHFYDMLTYNIENPTQIFADDDELLIDFFNCFHDLGMSIHIDNNALLVKALKHHNIIFAEHLISQGAHIANAIEYASDEDKTTLKKYQLALTLHEEMELKEDNPKLKL